MDKPVFAESPFLHLINREGYVFLHMVRTQGRLMAIVPFRLQDQQLQFLARIEICPAHAPANTSKADMTAARYSITGGPKADETLPACAVRELSEEAGYVVNPADLIDLGQVYPSKQEDTIAQLYSVDLSGLSQNKIEGDGSEWEEGAGVEWVSYAVGLQIADPLFVTALVRVHALLKGEL